MIEFYETRGGRCRRIASTCRPTMSEIINKSLKYENYEVLQNRS